MSIRTAGGRPAGYRARHRRGHGRPDRAGRWIVAQPEPPAYNPLPPAVRLRLAPTAWGRDDVALHAGELDATGRLDPAAVLTAAPRLVDMDRTAVMAGLRAELATAAALTWADLGAAR